MYYVYILKSKKDEDLYVGSTNDLKRRLSEHNAGKIFSTKSRFPFELIYYEAFKAESDARMRESNLKDRGHSRRHLLKRLQGSLQ